MLFAYVPIVLQELDLGRITRGRRPSVIRPRSNEWSTIGTDANECGSVFITCPYSLIIKIKLCMRVTVASQIHMPWSMEAMEYGTPYSMGVCDTDLP